MPQRKTDPIPSDVMAERAKLKAEYGRPFETIGEMLFRLDPIGINFEGNADEYHPETGAILPRLKDCADVRDVQKVIYEEFVRWFGIETAGPEAKYRAVATEVWRAWQSHRGQGLLA